MLNKFTRSVAVFFLLVVLTAFAYPFVTAVSSAEVVPQMDAIRQSQITDATLWMVITFEQDDDVQHRAGYGTVVERAGQTVIVTHNHWTPPTFDPSIVPSRVKIYTIDKTLLTTLSGEEFFQLVRYQDEGTLVTSLPFGIDVVPIGSNQIGTGLVFDETEIFFLMHVDKETREVSFLPARQISAITPTGAPSVSFQTLTGESIHKGDSGGGVWYNGQLVGNMWATVSLTWPETLFRREAKVEYSDQSFMAVFLDEMLAAEQIEELETQFSY